MKRLHFWILRKLNDNFPSRKEAAWYCANENHTTKMKQILVGYGMLRMSIEELAKTKKCTRERIRQIILKGCRK